MASEGGFGPISAQPRPQEVDCMSNASTCSQSLSISQPKPPLEQKEQDILQAKREVVDGAAGAGGEVAPQPDELSAPDAVQESKPAAHPAPCNPEATPKSNDETETSKEDSKAPEVATAASSSAAPAVASTAAAPAAEIVPPSKKRPRPTLMSDEMKEECARLRKGVAVNNASTSTSTSTSKGSGAGHAVGVLAPNEILRDIFVTRRSMQQLQPPRPPTPPIILSKDKPLPKARDKIKSQGPPSPAERRVLYCDLVKAEAHREALELKLKKLRAQTHANKKVIARARRHREGVMKILLKACHREEDIVNTKMKMAIMLRDAAQALRDRKLELERTKALAAALKARLGKAEGKPSTPGSSAAEGTRNKQMCERTCAEIGARWQSMESAVAALNVQVMDDSECDWEDMPWPREKEREGYPGFNFRHPEDMVMSSEDDAYRSARAGLGRKRLPVMERGRPLQHHQHAFNQVIGSNGGAPIWAANPRAPTPLGLPLILSPLCTVPDRAVAAVHVDPSTCPAWWEEKGGACAGNVELPHGLIECQEQRLKLLKVKAELAQTVSILHLTVDAEKDMRKTVEDGGVGARGIEAEALELRAQLSAETAAYNVSLAALEKAKAAKPMPTKPTKKVKREAKALQQGAVQGLSAEDQDQRPARKRRFVGKY